jgi:hypothetical protein
MTIDDAVREVFTMMAAKYGRKWDIPAQAMPAWATQFEADGVEPHELLAVAKVWSDVKEWPPSFAELKTALPRFCRCGDCRACQSRALERAKAAVSRGSIGASSFVQPSISEMVASNLDERRRLLARQAEQLRLQERAS